jgi:AcrR family transcriptional regulator
MPRRPNPLLEDRILNEARKLFVRGGEKALSMRVLARVAHTNTPAVYRRFRNRKELLRALLHRTQRDLLAALEPCRSLPEACHKTVDFIVEHHHEYQLISAGIFTRIEEPRVTLEFMKQRSAEWLGGAPDDHTRLVLALWPLVHGTGTLLSSKTVPAQHEAELRSVFADVIGLVLANASAGELNFQKSRHRATRRQTHP